jgi:hypothetical protein
MLRLFLITSLLLTTLFTAALAGLHAQPPPPDDSAAYFGDCTMPCWQGVQPGVTLHRDALSALNTRGWVLHGQCNAAVYDDCDLFKRDDADLVAYLYIGAGQVKQIALFRTGLVLGDVWLALGSPEYAAISPTSYRAISLNTALWFSPSEVSTRMNFPCPVGFAEMLRIPVSTILVWANGTSMQGTVFGSVSELRLAMHRVCAA